MALNATGVYWANGAGNVLSCPLAGCGDAAAAVASSFGGYSNLLAADDGHLYWLASGTAIGGGKLGPVRQWGSTAGCTSPSPRRRRRGPTRLRRTRLLAGAALTIDGTDVVLLDRYGSGRYSEFVRCSSGAAAESDADRDVLRAPEARRLVDATTSTWKRTGRGAGLDIAPGNRSLSVPRRVLLVALRKEGALHPNERRYVRTWSRSFPRGPPWSPTLGAAPTGSKRTPRGRLRHETYRLVEPVLAFVTNVFRAVVVPDVKVKTMASPLGQGACRDRGGAREAAATRAWRIVCTGDATRRRAARPGNMRALGSGPPGRLVALVGCGAPNRPGPIPSSVPLSPQGLQGHAGAHGFPFPLKTLRRRDRLSDPPSSWCSKGSCRSLGIKNARSGLQVRDGAARAAAKSGEEDLEAGHRAGRRARLRSQEVDIGTPIACHLARIDETSSSRGASPDRRGRRLQSRPPKAEPATEVRDEGDRPARSNLPSPHERLPPSRLASRRMGRRSSPALSLSGEACALQGGRAR